MKQKSLLEITGAAAVAEALMGTKPKAKKEKKAKDCAPHTYRQDRKGIWVCHCGQILPSKKKP